MLIVPVIDIMGGRVVRAMAGDRASYLPIETPLCPGTSDPVVIARSLVATVPGCDRLYVADLDGIMLGSPQTMLVRSLIEAVPGCRWLVDDGLSHLDDARRWAERPDVVPVIGTEVLPDAGMLVALSERLEGHFALSLDHRGDERIGPAALFEDVVSWPDTVIVMELSRVGTGAGPDLERLTRYKLMAGGRHVLAAGGVRGIADLRTIAGAGCGALIASALHSGALAPQSLAEARDA